ncbi:hypothetical protein EVAR_17290_1 [Eumeta japonica]|uniref:Uncharacterized protein n=1 Tax=Eumeta variegata TaxID=151549 RepID=A0A4C1TT55_EUMVA|nr:hypothetical protein EVAR_17290_1 [Eumeta japonica]
MKNGSEPDFRSGSGTKTRTVVDGASTDLKHSRTAAQSEYVCVRATYFDKWDLPQRRTARRLYLAPLSIEMGESLTSPDISALLCERDI